MYRIFASERYPYIRGGLGGFDPDVLLRQLRTVPAEARLDFDLTMHGITRPVRAAVLDFAESPEALQIVFRFAAELEAHGMVRPRLLGLPMVGEVITIEITTDLSRQE